MSRLFITPRELNFISDITKEFMKDVVGQKVYYYSISEHQTKTHGVYNEAVRKVFDSPIALDALVDNNFQVDTKINTFGIDAQYKIEIFLQHRDLIDKGINVNIGDVFSFSDIFYEITERTFMRNIYGLPEHKDGVKLVGTKARAGFFDAIMKGPTDIARPEPDAVQQTFEQQRGYATDSAGEATGDKRDLVKNGVLDEPISGPRKVSPEGDKTGSGSTFYDE